MFYLIPAATIAMLAYMLFRTAFLMRRDRVRAQREQTRGKFTFRPQAKMRFLLNRAYTVRDDNLPNEAELLRQIDQHQIDRRLRQ